MKKIMRHLFGTSLLKHRLKVPRVGKTLIGSTLFVFLNLAPESFKLFEFLNLFSCLTVSVFGGKLENTTLHHQVYLQACSPWFMFHYMFGLIYDFTRDDLSKVILKITAETLRDTDR